MSALKILLVEDQSMVLGALAALLRLDKNIASVETAKNAEQAKQILNGETFDLVVSDIEMPGASGIELLQHVAIAFPRVKKVLITTFRRAGYVKRAIDASVDAFILKDSPPEELIKSLLDVMDGKRVIDPELLLESLNVTDPLTDKERCALRMARTGKTNQEIADSLFLTLGTTKNYISSCIAKLGGSNRLEAIRIAEKKGLL